jgi:hypothetical protein
MVLEFTSQFSMMLLNVLQRFPNVTPVMAIILGLSTDLISVIRCGEGD